MKQESKSIILFFAIRVFGVFMGLITLSYQYQFENNLRQYFHQFPFLLVAVYFFDGGYSEKVTQTNTRIAPFFLKKILWVFIITFFLSVSSYFLIPFSTLYVKWLALSLIFIPFQMYADVIYRTILTSKKSLSFVIYQALSPTIILVCLILLKKKHLTENLWAIFLMLNIVIQIVYLFSIYITQNEVFDLSRDNNNFKKLNIIAILYKILPLFFYEIYTITYNTFTNGGFGLEMIRSCYFISGFLLLVVYTKNILIKEFTEKFKIGGLFVAILLSSSAVGCAIAAAKLILFKTMPHVSKLDFYIYALAVLSFATYLFYYTKWVFKN